MSNNRIITISVLLLLVMTSGAFSASGGEGEDRSNSIINEKSGRAPSEDTTGYTIDPPDMDLVERMDNVSLVDGNRISFDRNVIREFSELPASPETSSNLQSGKNIVVSGHMSFFSIIRGSSSDGYFSFYLLRYDDRYDNFEGPILVSNITSFSSATSRLHIHDGRLFYLMSLENANPSLSRIFVKSINTTEWYNITSIPQIRLDSEGQTTLNAEIASTDNATVVLWTAFGNEPDRLVTFSDGEWGAPVMVPVQGSIYWPMEIVRSGTRWIYLYLTNDDGRYINMTKTSNGGKTWSQIKSMVFTDKAVQSASMTYAQGKVHMAIVHTSVREIGYTRSSDGESWSGVRKIADYYTNYRDTVEEAVISGDDAQIMIVYENSTGRISSIVSDDNGNTFSTPKYLSYYYSHHPSMDSEKRFYSFINGSNLEIRWFEPSRGGFVRTVMLSPLALRSWDQLGIQYSGFETGGRIDLRILSGSWGGQLFPGSGYVDVFSHPEGMIRGRSYSSVIELTGDWSTLLNLEHSIIVEIVLERGGYDHPSLNYLAVDYTTSFPMTESFSAPSHIWSYDNLTLDENGLTLTDTDHVGHAVIGPIGKETNWPDVLGIHVDSLNDNIKIKAEIMDHSRSPYPGFKISDCRSMNDIDSVNYMKWGTRSFQDIPDTIDEVFIHVSLEALISGFKPSISGISLEYSDPPEIISASMEVDTIYRGETAEISFELMDREDRLEDLDIIMTSGLVGTSEWSESMTSGSITEDGLLKVIFITNYSTEIGEYRLSAYCIDSNGNRSEQMEMDFTLNVINIRPTPPMIYTDPPVLYHGTDLTVGILQDGTDLETAQEELTYNVRFIKEGFTFKEVLNTTDSTVSIGPDVLRKGEIWNVEVRTWDGTQESIPSMLPIYVQNSEPEIDDPPANLTISEDSPPTAFDLTTWFSDMDEDFLDFEVEASVSLTAVVDDGKLIITPATDYFGDGTITITATDGMENVSIMIPVFVSQVNDPPWLGPVMDHEVFEGEWLHVDICSCDEADGDYVSISNNLLDLIPGITVGLDYQEAANGSFYFRPDNSMVGAYTILVTSFDGKAYTNVSFNLTIINVNDPPGKPMILVDQSDLVIVGSRMITLRANGSDPDLNYGGEELTYLWSSDISGELGSGEMINVTLPPGDHTITLRVEDSTGSYNETSILITVGEDPDETGESTRTMTLLILLGIIAFLIGLIVGVIILVIARKKDKGETGKADEEKKDETGKAGEKEKPVDEEKKDDEPTLKGTGDGIVDKEKGERGDETPTGKIKKEES